MILPLTVIRRFDCILSDSKDAVLAKYEEVKNLPMKDVLLRKASGFDFYNTSKYTFERLMDDPDHIEDIGHLQTRAVENVTTTVSVNTIFPYQTAPTAVFDKSGRICMECGRQEELLVYDYVKMDDDFGETGRRNISNQLTVTL